MAGMTSDAYQDDYVTRAELDGEPFDSFDDDEEEDEEDEEEGSDTSVGYGSLLSLGSGMRKKQPLILVDPIEAENEARRVQFVAAQQFVAADESEATDFLNGLPQLGEPDVIVATEPEYEAPSTEAERGVDVSAAIVSDEVVTAYPPDAGEDGAMVALQLEETEMPLEVADPLFLEADREAPVVTARVEAMDEPIAVDAVAPAETEPTLCELVSSWPDPAPQGHSLRARIPTRPPRRTFANHVSAILGWFYERLMPDRT